MFINHSPASTMNHHQPWMVPFRRASRMLRTFRATKLQWKMHHTWIPIPWEHRGGDLGRPWNMGIWDENWAGKNIWKNEVMGKTSGSWKHVFFFLHADEKFGTLGELPPSMRWQALIPQHDEDRTREKRYSWNTVWLFNVANWNITILLIGKSCQRRWPTDDIRVLEEHQLRDLHPWHARCSSVAPKFVIFGLYLVDHPTNRKWVITYNPSYKWDK